MLKAPTTNLLNQNLYFKIPGDLCAYSFEKHGFPLLVPKIVRTLETAGDLKTTDACVPPAEVPT